MEQNNNITPDTREYEGRRYRLVTDEIGNPGSECKRCPMYDKCDSEDIFICEQLFGHGNCIGKRLEDVTDLEMMLMMDDVRQALDLHHPQVIDLMVCAQRLMVSAIGQIADRRDTPQHKLRQLADSLADTLRQAMHQRIGETPREETMN